MSMDVDEEPTKNVLAASGTTGSVSVSLHPLVIMNVSEHWTRVRAQEGKPLQVIGALIGKQKGRNIEIMNSFELMFDQIEGDIVIDKDYYSTKEQQFKQVFSDLDFLGWYTTGDTVNESDIKVHKQICEINESPVFLKLNPVGRHTELPVSMYESVIDLVSGEMRPHLSISHKNDPASFHPPLKFQSGETGADSEATMLFVELPYTLATEEAERIGLDHMARMSTNDSGESSLVAEQLQAQHSAIKMLYSRVHLILDYVRAVKEGKVAANHEILREAYSLCHRLPVIANETFKEEYFNQCNDVGLMTYLGTLTKGCNTINQFVNKFNILYDRQGMGRRMKGFFF